MPIVYAVQRPLRRDKQSGELVPKFPHVESQVREYGTLVWLLGSGARPFNPGPVVRELHEKLQAIRPEDYLLLIGNPVIMAWTAAIASRYLDGNLKILQWSGKGNESYRVVVARV